MTASGPGHVEGSHVLGQAAPGSSSSLEKNRNARRRGGDGRLDDVGRDDRGLRRCRRAGAARRLESGGRRIPAALRPAVALQRFRFGRRVAGALGRGSESAQRTAAAAFSPRYEHQVVVFNDQLWLIGGSDSSYNLKNDVWSSTDGFRWTQHTANAAFSPRSNHEVVVFNNRLWLIGGAAGRDGTHRTDETVPARSTTTDRQRPLPLQ